MALIIGGGWCTYEWLINGGRGIMFKAGAFVAVFGLYLLWADFISSNREPL
ncbi:hypothetical protein [Tardiphaga sp. 841_E9_N1_2]|uniref:hypothetical protein n=1 Tax=Tardiphaga sp. 841_E9_N1_2 TaxID=3240762 RepID=UPI003F22DE52